MYDAKYIEQKNFFDMSMTSPPGRSYKYYEGTPLWPVQTHTRLEYSLFRQNNSTHFLTH